MTFDVTSLAKKKQQETHYTQEEWLRALENANLTLKPSDITDKGLQYIALASPSPDHFALLTRLIYQYGKLHPNGVSVSNLLFSCVNASRFNLTDWIISTSYFHGWLVEKNRRVDFLSMIRYLECSAAAPDAKEAGQTLLSLVKEMLDVHGYEGRSS